MNECCCFQTRQKSNHFTIELSHSLCAAPRDLGRKENHGKTDACQVLGFWPLHANQQNDQSSVGYT